MIGSKTITMAAGMTGALQFGQAVREVTGYGPSFWVVSVASAVVLRPYLKRGRGLDCPLTCQVVASAISVMVAWLAVTTMQQFPWFEDRLGIDWATAAAPAGGIIAAGWEDILAVLRRLVESRFGGKK